MLKRDSRDFFRNVFLPLITLFIPFCVCVFFISSYSLPCWWLQCQPVYALRLHIDVHFIKPCNIDYISHKKPFLPVFMCTMSYWIFNFKSNKNRLIELAAFFSKTTDVTLFAFYLFIGCLLCRWKLRKNSN